MDDGIIVLPARVDIAAAGTLRERILSGSGDLVLDAGAVNLVATPAVQVLMAARDHQQAQGHALRITHMSTGFRACLATLGVTTARLMTPEVTS